MEVYRETIVGIATSLLNKPSIKYRRGHPELGQSPVSGFDCSGFVTFVLKTAGLFVPDYIGMDGVRRSTRHASEYWDHYGVAVHDEFRQPADLIFFAKRGQSPKHIGIVRDEETYIHAPGHDDTTVEVRPIVFEHIIDLAGEGVLYTRNPIGFKSPTRPIEQPTYRHHQTPI